MEIRENLKATAIVIGVSIGLLWFLIPLTILTPLMIVLAALVFGLLLIFSQEADRPKTIMKVFLTGFTLRLIACCLLAWLAYLKRGHIFFLGADDYGHSLNALKIVAAWKETGYVPGPNSLVWMPWAGDLNYPYMISFLYYFIGEYRLMLLFINCSLGAVSIVLIYLVSREIYNRKVALASTLLFAFWPSIFLWSTQNLKESVTVFIILVVFWAIINLRKNINQFSYWIALLASFIFMFKIRSMFAVILFFVLAVALLPVLFSKKMRYNLFLVLAISVPLMIINWPAIDSFLHHHLRLPGETIFASLNYAHSVRTWAAETAFLVDVDISSPLKFMYHLPSFLAYVLFSPFPWAVSKVRHLFGTMEMSIWMVLVVFAGKGLFVTIRYKLKEALFMLVFLGIILLSFFGEGNVGTLFRHRALIWPCWHMLIAAGLFYHLKQEPESIS